MMSVGVFLGAPTPLQALASKPGKNSCKAGTSGNLSERVCQRGPTGTFEHVTAGWAALAELKRSGSTGRSFHYATKKAARHIPAAQAEDSPAMGEFPTSTATDTDLIALGGQLEGLLREYMDAWLEWAPRMRAARAEAKDNMSA